MRRHLAFLAAAGLTAGALAACTPAALTENGSESSAASTGITYSLWDPQPADRLPEVRRRLREGERHPRHHRPEGLGRLLEEPHRRHQLRNRPRRHHQPRRPLPRARLQGRPHRPQADDREGRDRPVPVHRRPRLPVGLRRQDLRHPPGLGHHRPRLQRQGRHRRGSERRRPRRPRLEPAGRRLLRQTRRPPDDRRERREGRRARLRQDEGRHLRMGPRNRRRSRRPGPLVVARPVQRIHLPRQEPLRHPLQPRRPEARRGAHLVAEADRRRIRHPRREGRQPRPPADDGAEQGRPRARRLLEDQHLVPVRGPGIRLRPVAQGPRRPQDDHQRARPPRSPRPRSTRTRPGSGSSTSPPRSARP